jgi:hypothetical protein
MMPEMTPGRETSEHDAMQAARVWIRFATAVVSSVATALLATGVIPPDSAWIGILTLLGSLGTMVVGEVAAARNYTASRTAVKEAALRANGNPTAVVTYTPPEPSGAP